MNRTHFIYFDNAATTFPKPPRVVSAMVNCMEQYCANPGRSGHRLALLSEEKVFGVRRRLSAFFNCKDPMQVVFTKNATEGLNLVIGSLAVAGGRVVCTAYEHNSVVRPLHRQFMKGRLTYDLCQPNASGDMDPGIIESRIGKDTVAVIVSLASNTTGYIMPIRAIGDICQRRGIYFIVDASQGAGTLQPDMEANNIHVLVGTGHKDLYGPQGTGFICMNGFKALPLLDGGTGTDSLSLNPIVKIPNSLEAGTLNLPGIVGLGEGVAFVSAYGSSGMLAHKTSLVDRMRSGLSGYKGITVYAPKENCGIVAIDMGELDSQEAVEALSTQYGVCARGGFHCAPNIHRFLKTTEKGLVRFSFGVYNQTWEVDYVLEALASLLKKLV